MQMIHILNGEVTQKTIPYIINQHLTTEQFREALIRMLKEIMGKQLTSLIKK